ncbi:hypothetical protein Ndes2526B_g09309 [Nannochloris sp. 'desiccata']|nr:putative DnaJ-like protein subfamily B member 3 [Chlorella desiccata (nom. nud.)]
MGRSSSRSRSRERRRNRSRSGDRKRHRSSSRSRERYSRDRDRRRDRSNSRERHSDRRHHHHRRSRSRSRDRSRREEHNTTREHNIDKADAGKQAARAAKLQAWKQQKQQEPDQPPETAVEAALRRAQEAAATLANKSTGDKEVEYNSEKQLEQLEQEEEIDPLDAFMASEVLPEVKAKEAEEKRIAQEETKKLKELFTSGRIPKALQDLIADEDEEERPDEIIEIPANKLKLVIGPGGDKIKEIERRSKCRIQHTKDSVEMNRGFGLGVAAIAKAAVVAAASGEKKMITLQLFGNADACEMAREMIIEAVENREQKAKQKEKGYEKKRAAKSAQRHIYHLRHSKDYEVLELPLGASKADIKVAFRKLALKWHPDKNKDCREEAEKRFQEISRAYESLMTTDEDIKVEQLGF